MSQNIQVAVRVRPLLPSEIPAMTSNRRQTLIMDREVKNVPSKTIVPLDSKVLSFDPQKRPEDKKTYAFDAVYGEASTQQDIFEGTAKLLVEHFMDGYNTTLFAYGATSCGKSYTITGSDEDPGIISRTMQEVFIRMEEMSENNSSEISLSYLEVYNETIKDLFQPGKSLDLREDDSRVQIAGLSEKFPKNLREAMKLITKGNDNRRKAFTEANASSSRSHAVLQINIKIKSRAFSTADTIKISTFNIIDLAGSERASATQNKGERLNEGANINRSLLALGNCINALCSLKPAHIPYRNSKLTRLLKFSLSGNCKVVMIVNCSPALMHAEESHNTLKYADRAKEIKTKVTQNTIDVSNQILQYPKIILELREEISRLKLLTMNSTVSLPIVDSDDSGDAVIEKYILKCKTLLAKMEAKEILINQCELDISANQMKITNIKELLQLVIDSTKLEDRKGLNTSAIKISDELERLEASNLVLYQTAEEATSSLIKYNERLDDIVRKTEAGLVQNKMKEYLSMERKTKDGQVATRYKLQAKESTSKISTEQMSAMKINLAFVRSSMDSLASGEKLQVTRAFGDLLVKLGSVGSLAAIEDNERPHRNQDEQLENHELSNHVEEAFSDAWLETPKKRVLEAHTIEQLLDDETPKRKKAKTTMKAPLRVVKGTPGTPGKFTRTVAKTPKRKPRLSLIPRINFQEPLPTLMSLRSRTRKS